MPAKCMPNRNRPASGHHVNDSGHPILLVPWQVADEGVIARPFERYNRRFRLKRPQRNLAGHMVVIGLRARSVAGMGRVVAHNPLVANWILVDQLDADRYAR